MRHVYSMLASACVFPRSVSERILDFSRDNATERFVQKYVAMQLRTLMQVSEEEEEREQVRSALFDLWPFSMRGWRNRVLDHRVLSLAKAIKKCIKKYGEEHVLFEG